MLSLRFNTFLFQASLQKRSGTAEPGTVHPSVEQAGLGACRAAPPLPSHLNPSSLLPLQYAGGEVRLAGAPDAFQITHPLTSSLPGLPAACGGRLCRSFPEAAAIASATSAAFWQRRIHVVSKDCQQVSCK